MYICRWRCALKVILGKALTDLGKENGTATRRTAKPWTSVRFPSLPRFKARVAELVDATDLKSVVRKDVPVRVRPWAPRKFIFFESKIINLTEMYIIFEGTLNVTRQS